MSIFDNFDSRLFGFDRFFSDLEWLHSHQPSTFPPYDIVQDGDYITLTLAVAGFGPKNLRVSADDGWLTVQSVETKKEGEVAEPRYLHKGIAQRKFSQRFRLAEGIEVQQVYLSNGLLTIHLRRLPARSTETVYEIGSEIPNTTTKSKLIGA